MRTKEEIKKLLAPDDAEEENTSNMAFEKLPNKPKKAKTSHQNNGLNISSDINDNVHSGHRARMRAAADADLEFNTFSEHQVLEYLLFITIPRIDVNILAHDLINKFGSLAGVFSANVEELKECNYINENTARLLTSIIPASRKAEISRKRHTVFLDTTSRAASYIRSYFANRNNEVFYMAALDINDRLKSMVRISDGDTNFTVFDVKKIISGACRHSANKVIIAHNHPAGTLEPSLSDIEATIKICVSLSAMGILLVDHLIFTSDDYYSFFNNGLMDRIYANCDNVFGSRIMEEVRQRKRNLPDRYIFEKDQNMFFEGGIAEALALNLPPNNKEEIKYPKFPRMDKDKNKK